MIVVFFWWFQIVAIDWIKWRKNETKKKRKIQLALWTLNDRFNWFDSSHIHCLIQYYKIISNNLLIRASNFLPTPTHTHVGFIPFYLISIFIIIIFNSFLIINHRQFHITFEFRLFEFLSDYNKIMKNSLFHSYW